jgi:hypothetical protein
MFVGAGVLVLVEFNRCTISKHGKPRNLFPLFFNEKETFIVCVCVGGFFVYKR